MFSDNDVIDSRFKDTEFVVEADGYAQQQLWYDYHKPNLNEVAGAHYGTFVPDKNKVEWVEDCRGAFYQTGELDGRPVCTNFFWAKLDGHLIVFYDNTSQVVDTVQVEQWLNKNCWPKWDNGTRIAITNADNFHHVINHIRESDEKHKGK